MKTMIDLAVMMAEPAAENWIQIMKTGEFDHQKLGKLKITKDNLHRFKENFDNGVRGTDLAVDVSHNPDAGAVAWFKELKVDDDKLMAKVAWTEEGKELIESGKYRYFSPEFSFKYKDAEKGEEFKDVLFGGAITNRPFLKNMDPIQFDESDTYGTVWMAENEPYDPDDDGDDDKNTDPKANPDWMMDVLCGITPWPSDPKQQAQLKAIGATKEACDACCAVRQKQLKGTKPKSEPAPKTGVATAKKPEGGMGMSEKTEAIMLAENNAMKERIKLLEEENKRVKMSDKVKGFMFSESTKKGKILPAQQEKVLELMMGMDDAQVAKFEEVVNALPDAISFNDESGFGNAGQPKDRDTMVLEKAEALFAEGKTDDFRKAVLMAEAEIPEVIK